VTTLVLLTRDLRIHDNPALAAAARRSDRVVPLFVLDPAILGSPATGANRLRFLRRSLEDLDRSLRRLGAGLVVRSGDPVDQAVRLAREAGAEAIHLSDDVSAYAARRLRRLSRAADGERIAVRTFPGVTVVPAGELAPAGADHFRVFTPYWRRWTAAGRRAVLAPPRRLALPDGVAPDTSGLDRLDRGRVSPDLPEGGETAGRRRLAAWGRAGLRHYGEGRDDLAADATSRLSADLHLGCLSPLEVAERLGEREGGEPFVRQLCWRDFHHQLLRARPRLPEEDMRPRGDRWRDDDEGFAAWCEGRTGVPVVDAGMRQLLREGWMHNRARLLTASFLTKDLRIDWRLGARHFFDLLVDGDLANNVGNWQWVAGTGADTRPNRILNPWRQAARLDPDGRYVRRYVPEGGEDGYPAPIVDHDEAAARLRASRGRGGRGR
jgi:deoxyribodipyrimidine photo-lyase